MRTGSRVILIAALLIAVSAQTGYGAKKTEKQPSPIDNYIREANKRGTEPVVVAAPGSIWSPSARFSDSTRDLRAGQTDDVITILIVEKASGTATGTTKSGRSSSASNSIGALAGLTRAVGPLANLAKLSGETKLNGEGTTSRESVLSTTLSARVTHVLPNGSMVVEGSKTVQINSEQQSVTVRGVVRPTDLTPGNMVRSDRISDLDVRINGKGVVGDSIRRPHFLYRLLLGLLPF
ncbi:MAG: flagellar basal body L-ring protein FlgH [Bryobacterales bacterium]|nr:flagellar basal body L-ring protein FlgH [Bryobacterales bacterium]